MWKTLTGLCVTFNPPRPDFGIPPLLTCHFDSQTRLQLEAQSQEKANGVEMLREQEKLEWGSFSLTV